MNGILDVFSQGLESLSNDVLSITRLLDRIYCLISSQETPTQHKRFLLSLASDLEDDR